MTYQSWTAIQAVAERLTEKAKHEPPTWSKDELERLAAALQRVLHAEWWK